jgi:hypothetical protein
MDEVFGLTREIIVSQIGRFSKVFARQEESSIPGGR